VISSAARLNEVILLLESIVNTPSLMLSMMAQQGDWRSDLILQNAALSPAVKLERFFPCDPVIFFMCLFFQKCISSHLFRQASCCRTSTHSQNHSKILWQYHVNSFCAGKPHGRSSRPSFRCPSEFLAAIPSPGGSGPHEHVHRQETEGFRQGRVWMYSLCHIRQRKALRYYERRLTYY
jgi:hypothetical protein